MLYKGSDIPKIICNSFLFVLEEREHKICVYREELCIHEKLFRQSNRWETISISNPEDF